MAKLMLSPFVFILISVSAQPDLPGPDTHVSEYIWDDSSMPNTKESHVDLTLLLSSACCLLVVIVVGLLIYIIRLKKSTLNEPGANAEEPIYEEVQLPENFGNSPRQQMAHETINILYGAFIPRGK
ncbi:uncharacterized protein [Macrobrachium rosenbergii]|uniref:uncharacterized protein isoform X2 n=1 Tax=Macrobrachium rosenbergii TaxID=79674 RepID=UPI0034D5914E